MTEQDRIRELEHALQKAIWRLRDMLEGDDGQAWKEAEKVLPELERTLGREVTIHEMVKG